ncbi:M20/M25/M40 family metallo-hydrolase [Actinosynnema pretiosum subsp. pretiosum]|uniref:Vacuolar membrane protease n=1 Tax=Actinosynnema pretiosum subsp. pretiosum TaxID=103721 RepID=A0AA45LCB4_9PSEU|nr:Peptidase, M20/M25/M40 family [Actinosynnema pretiosum subsp. pretiosum]QUF06685.1 M20/M25/M40 family metallo-hydrolase [Actinosynnema pretiosum subsp. pretiosum]
MVGVRLLRVLSLLLVVAAVGVLSALAFRPPRPVAADAPDGGFSSGRAMAHLREIAQRPHPIGSEENARVRSVIAGIARGHGAEVVEEADRVLVELPERGVTRDAVVHNVVARVPGTAPGGRALLVVAHHDSVPTGPGAADDGAAVAAMLEAIRALGASGGVRDDVVFLFTDGEETGSVGARAFVARHGVAGFSAVLNFEARGSGGPVWMFETGAGNGPLVSAFAGASSRPIGNSLAKEVYRLMPNYSDFTVFTDAGANGLNSAFIEHVEDYHSIEDTPDGLDEGSLQHHGETVLGLVRTLGNADPGLVDSGFAGGDAVYFDLFSRVQVGYPVWFAVGLAVVTALGLVAGVVVGARRGRICATGVLRVFGVLLGAVVVAAVAALLGWRLVARAQPRVEFAALDNPAEPGWFTAGFCLLGLAALLVAARLLRGRRPGELVAGGLLLGALPLVAAAVLVPGATWLLQWPLLAGLPALWWAALRDGSGGGSALLESLAPLVAAALYPPVVGTLLVALGTPLLVAGVGLAGVAGVLLAPLLVRLPARGWAGLGAAVVAAGLVVVGVQRAEPTLRTALLYLDDRGGASWLSGDPEVSAWTWNALGERPERGVLLKEDFPMLTGPLLRAPAPAGLLDPPGVQVSAGAGIARVAVRPGAGVWRTQVVVPAGCRSGGRDLPAGVVEFYGQAGGFELECPVGAELAVTDHRIGLPAEVAALLPPRPAGELPVQSGSRAYDGALTRVVVRL